MGLLFLIVFFLVSFMIVGLVLLQEGKGGGLTGMSTGMDGVMGAKNPLRRLTAYLFAFFVVMAITINWYFHQRTDTSLPAGVALPEPTRMLQETTPLGGTTVTGEPVPEGSLRPEDGEAATAPVRPEGEAVSPAPAEPVRPEGAPEPAAEMPAAPAETPTQPEAASDEGSALRPDTPAEETPAAAPVQPPAE